MLLMAEKGIREGISHSNNKYMKDYDKINNIFNIGM